jgi:hypothetical protein
MVTPDTPLRLTPTNISTLVNVFGYGLMETELLPLGFPAIDLSGVLFCGLAAVLVMADYNC